MDKVESAAGRILKRFPGLPLSMEVLCAYFDIDLFFADMKSYDAFYMMTHLGRRLIMVNDSLARARQRFSIAHEVGHAYLGHAPFDLSARGGRPSWQEVEANRFAAALLMPPKVIVQMLAPEERTPERISRLCDVSLGAARIRAKSLGWCELVRRAAKKSEPQAARLAG